MHRVIERILNLLAFLLTAKRPVTADEIRRTVAGYDQQSHEAWRRMFERDKGLLRDLGIPLELRPTDAWQVEHGYVVTADSYALADPGLTDEERVALSLAAHAVRIGGQVAGPDALFKLGGGSAHGGGEPLAADLGESGESLAEAFSAVVDHRALQFDYSGHGRVIEPYGLIHRRGHWYVVGADTGDGHIVKNFRVDRAGGIKAVGPVDAFERPAGFRAGDAVAPAAWEAGGEDLEAEITFDASIAWWAKRQLTGRSSITERQDGSLVATIPVANAEAFIGWMLSFDAAAEIVAPHDLRERLLARVRAAG